MTKEPFDKDVPTFKVNILHKRRTYHTGGNLTSELSLSLVLNKKKIRGI